MTYRQSGYTQGYLDAIGAALSAIHSVNDTRTIGPVDSKESQYFEMGQHTTLRSVEAAVSALLTAPYRTDVANPAETHADAHRATFGGVEPPTRLTPIEPVAAPTMSGTDEVKDYGYGADADGIQQIPPYVPVERVDTLVRCNRCGAVVEGDVVATTQHDIWHASLVREIRHARAALPQVYR